MISKELLSEVLQKKVIDIILLANEYELENNIFESFPNIHELTYELKEWAKNEGYTIISGYDQDFIGQKYKTAKTGYFCSIQDKDFIINDFYCKTETDSIIEACEYIKKVSKINQLLINIAKRLVCKAIKLNTEEYKIQVSYKYINGNAIDITIFNNENDCKSYMLYDSDWDIPNHLTKYKTILKKIRNKEL